MIASWVGFRYLSGPPSDDCEGQCNGLARKTECREQQRPGPIDESTPMLLPAYAVSFLLEGPYKTMLCGRVNP